MATLQIPPDTLEWAAGLAGRTLDALAAEIVPQSKRESFLAGKMTPTQAEKVASFASVPFGLLFLPKPPVREEPSIPDLRQTPHPEPLSRDFFEVLRDVLRKVEWYADYLRESGEEEPGVVGRFPYEDSPRVSSVAHDIVRALQLSPADRLKCGSYTDFYSLLVERTENQGVLVFKSGIVRGNTRRALSVSEFRGFAIPDRMAPTVFINGKDSEAAWIFTLLHELAHIWVGRGGISGDSQGLGNENKGLEWYCNRVAAEVLVPEKEFIKLWQQFRDTPIDRLASIFKVSRLVIARRAVEQRFIDWEMYNEIVAYRPRSNSGGGDPYRTIPVRNSKRFTRTLLTQALYGKTMLRDAARLLHVKPDTVVELAKRSLAQS